MRSRSRPGSAEAFSDREWAAIRFATAYAGDHHSIAGDDFTALREHFDDEEIMELLGCSAPLRSGSDGS